MKAMGRPGWQVNLVEKANENMLLLVCRNNCVDSKPTLSFTKHSTIYLNLSVLNFFSKLFSIPFDKVTYNHDFLPGEKQHYKNDQKQFGECSSLTIYHETMNVWTIKWYLAHGLLKVDYISLDQNSLQVKMVLTSANGEKTTCLKYYTREELTEQDHSIINGHLAKNKDASLTY